MGADQAQVRALIGVYDQAIQAIGGSGVRIFLRGLDVHRHRQRYSDPWPAHQVVLQHMLERLNDFGRSRGEQILVIADEITDPNRHRTNLQQFRLTGTPGYRSSQLNNILDTLHFAPSNHSRLIQAADLVTFLHRRRRTIPESDSRQAQAIERIWSHLASSIEHELMSQP